MRYLFFTLCCWVLFSCGEKAPKGYHQGYFYLTAPKSDIFGKSFKPYDREIQFNQQYIVGFKRGFDKVIVLREVYELATHKLYRFLTHHKTWYVYVEEHPETFIDMRTDVSESHYDNRIVPREDGNKKIKGFDTYELLYRDKKGRPKKMYVSPLIPFYLGHIPAIGKHIKGMPIEIREDSGLGLDDISFSMTYFDPKVSEPAFSTSEGGYIKVDKARFEAALQSVIDENFSFTDIHEEEREGWKHNFNTLFEF